jgi:hypothetical protein
MHIKMETSDIDMNLCMKSSLVFMETLQLIKAHSLYYIEFVDFHNLNCGQ